MSTVYLINPLSGGGKGLILKEQLTRVQRRHPEFEGEVLSIDSCSIADLRARLEDVGKVIIAGGDGTVSRALPCLVNRPLEVGVLPLGTGNDLSKELNVFRVRGRRLRLRGERELTHRLRMLDTAAARPCTIWRVLCSDGSGREALFCNYASFGFDAAAVARFDRGAGVLLNRVRYLQAGLLSLGQRLDSIELRDERGVGLALKPPLRSVFFANIRSVGGVGVSHPSSCPFDTLLETVVVRRLPEYLSMVLPWARPRPLRLPGSRLWSVHGMPLHTPVQIDGECRPDLQCPNYQISPAGTVKFLTLTRY